MFYDHNGYLVAGVNPAGQASPAECARLRAAFAQPISGNLRFVSAGRVVDVPFRNVHVSLSQWLSLSNDVHDPRGKQEAIRNGADRDRIRMLQNDPVVTGTALGILFGFLIGEVIGGVAGLQSYEPVWTATVGPALRTVDEEASKIRDQIAAQCGHYPDWGGPSGDRATRNGQIGMPGLYSGAGSWEALVNTFRKSGLTCEKWQTFSHDEKAYWVRNAGYRSNLYLPYETSSSGSIAAIDRYCANLIGATRIAPGVLGTAYGTKDVVHVKPGGQIGYPAFPWSGALVR